MLNAYSEARRLARATSAISRLHVRRTLAARVDVVSNILFGLLVAYALAFLWQALYESGTVDSEVTLEQMISYAVLGSVITTSLQTNTVFYADWRIRSGDVIFDVLRPLNWQLTLFADYAGSVSAQFIAVAIPVTLLSAAFLDFQAPASVLAGLLFLPSLVLGTIISFSVVFLVLLLAFRFTQVGGIESALRGFRPILTGALVPLWFFPSWLETAFRLLPFPDMAYTPVAIYVGEIEGSDIWLAVVRQFAWVVALGVIGAFFARRGMNKLSVQGG